MAILIPFFEKIINKAIQFDARTPQHLQILSEKQFTLEVTDLKIKISGYFCPQGIRLATQPFNSVDPDVTIKAPSSAFFLLATTKNSHAATKRGLTITGNTDVAQEMQTFLLNLNIDWEEALASMTGDSFAFTAFSFLNNIKKRKKTLLESLGVSTHDFLIEESRILPHPLEVDSFIKDVDHFREEVDRCEARINFLSKHSSMK